MFKENIIRLLFYKMNDEKKCSSSTTPISILDFLNDQYKSNSKSTVENCDSKLGVIYESKLENQKNVEPNKSMVKSNVSKGSLACQRSVKNINKTNDNGTALEEKLSLIDSIKQCFSNVVGKMSGTTVNKAAANTVSLHKHQVDTNNLAKIKDFSDDDNDVMKNCKINNSIQNFQTSVTRLMDRLCSLRDHEAKCSKVLQSTNRKFNKPKIESEKWDQSDPCVPFMSYDQFNIMNNTKCTDKSSLKPNKQKASISCVSNDDLNFDLKPSNHSVSKKTCKTNTCSKKSEKNIIELMKEVECLLKESENSLVATCINEKDFLIKKNKVKNLKTEQEQTSAEKNRKIIKITTKENNTKSENLTSCLDDVTKNLNKMSNDLGVIMNNINSMDLKRSKRGEKTSSSSSSSDDSDNSDSSIQSNRKNYSSDKKSRKTSKDYTNSYSNSEESKKVMTKSDRGSTSRNNQSTMSNCNKKKEMDYFLSKHDVDENTLKQNSLLKISNEIDSAKWSAENSPSKINRGFTITIKTTHTKKRKKR